MILLVRNYMTYIWNQNLPCVFLDFVKIRPVTTRESPRFPALGKKGFF